MDENKDIKIDLISKFLTDYEKIVDFRNESTLNLSKIDKELSDWYHTVETIDIKHISESHNLIKKVKVILEARRIYKLQNIQLACIHDSINSKMTDIKRKIDKTNETHLNMMASMKKHSNK